MNEAKVKLYPTVGLKKPGDHVMANFGQVPFQFDIDGYVKVSIRFFFECLKGGGFRVLPCPAKSLLTCSLDLETKLFVETTKDDYRQHQTSRHQQAGAWFERDQDDTVFGRF